MKTYPKVSIGIPTCYGGQSLVDTIKTIYNSDYKGEVEILVEADKTPLSSEVRKTLRRMKVKLHWNKTEGSQFKKLNQIIKRASGEIFIFTQDDIVFEPKAISEIVKAFNLDNQLTMQGAQVLSLPAETFFESTMITMMRLSQRIARSWNKGENYLLASARCLAFKKSHINKFRFFDQVVNTDVYMYFENQRLQGKFKPSQKAKVFIRNPQSLKDQLGPSSRYQYSKLDVSRFFKQDITDQFKIPVSSLLKGLIVEIFTNPIGLFSYSLVFFYTRLKRQSLKKALRTSWEIDISTKKVV